LYLNKGANKRIIPKYASVKVDWLNDSNVFTERYIDNPCMPNFWLCRESVARRPGSNSRVRSRIDLVVLIQHKKRLSRKRRHSFLAEKCLVCGQEVLADFSPLQFLLNPLTTVSPHLSSKLRLFHEVGNHFRDLRTLAGV